MSFASRPFALAAALLAGLASVAHAGEGSVHGALSAMATCQSCHADDKPAAGGLNPNRTDGNEELGTWRQSLVNVPPQNAAAREAGKLRIHPYVPWNSFLLDKLTGDLKDGEGDAMRGRLHPAGAGMGDPAEIERCPGLIDELSNWILAGAPGAPAIVPGDFDWPWIHCQRSQPLLGSLARPAPGAGYQIALEPFAVTRPEREGHRTTENLGVGNPGPEWVNRIEILASAGTEYLAIHRTGESAPLVVARGQRNPAEPYNRPDGNPGNTWGWVPEDGRVRLDVRLPEGVAVPIAALQTLTIEHRVRNEYWTASSSAAADYVNRTDGEAIVNFHTIAAEDVRFEAAPVLDTTGTDLLAAAPGELGVTGGAFTGVVNGAVLGLWTDQRAIATGLAAPASTSPPNAIPSVNTDLVLPVGRDVTRGYETFVPREPGQGVAYTCAHSNGLHDSALPANLRPGGSIQFLSRPPRYGCVADVDAPRALAGRDPIDVCHRASDCAAPETCTPVALVGGSGVHDGRCSLVGLVW